MTHPTTTAHALLGLLSIRSWTAYELAQQMKRALRWAWPRSEANLYSEIKRLVPQGLAEAVEEEAAGRARTRYEITDEGRAAVVEWLGTHPTSPPQLQFEALLRLFLADLGATEDLERTIADTRQQVIDRIHEAIPILEDYAAEEVPYPDRAHLNVLFMHYYAGFLRQLLQWCDDVEEEVGTWSGVTGGIGLTPGTRQMLGEALSFYRAAVAEQTPADGMT